MNHVARKILFLVPKIHLLEACMFGDVCADDNSVCESGICSCRAHYYFTQGSCGKFAN